MIAANHRNSNACLVEIGESVNEFEAALEIAPVAVKDVTGDHNKIDFFVDCKLDHLLEGALRGAGEIFRPAACAFA